MDIVEFYEIAMKFFLYSLVIYCLFPSAAIYSQQSSTLLYLESNIFQRSTRIIKLNDGSYWQIKLNSGYFFNDEKTGANWWRFERVCMKRNVDAEFPYLIENLENREILACKQYDPILDHNKVMILSPRSPLPMQVDENLSITAIIRTHNNLFIQLSDSSYWEVMAKEEGWFGFKLPETNDWNRFDAIAFKKSPYLDYPYILLNLVNQQELFCRQIDPAIPNSVHCRLKAPQTTDK